MRFRLSSLGCFEAWCVNWTWALKRIQRNWDLSRMWFTLQRHVTEIYKNVWKQRTRNPLISQAYYPIENWSSVNSHCVPLKEEMYKIDLRSQKWRLWSLGYRWDHFIHHWWQFTHWKTELLQREPVSQKCSTCFITLLKLEHHFVWFHFSGRKCLGVTMSNRVCLTIHPCTVSMSW